MRYCLILFIILGLLGINGCGRIDKGFIHKFSSEKKQESLEGVENVELAKAILRPQPYRFTIDRDPFRPLVGNRRYQGEEKIEVDAKTDIKVIGVVTLGEVKVAFLESPFKVGTFRVGDKISNYEIQEITPQRIVLTEGGKQVILKVGGEDE